MSVERAIHVLLPLKGSPVTAYPLDKVSLKFILFTDISMATDLLKLSPLPMQTLFAWVSQTECRCQFCLFCRDIIQQVIAT